jgi:hypothetical protein
MSTPSIDPERIERVSKALTAAMEAGNRLPYSLAMALEVAGLLAPTPEKTAVVAVLALHRKHTDSDHCFADDEQWPCQTRTLLDPTGLAAAVDAMGALPMPTGTPEPSPWERAVTGLNALADAKVAFWIEPDGHIANPFGDEHIEWDQAASRWRLVHDDENDDSHEAKVAEYLSTPYTDDVTSPDAEALAAVDRSIAAQFPAVAAFLAEDPHDGPLRQSYAVPHDLPEIPAQRDDGMDNADFFTASELYDMDRDDEFRFDADDDAR